MSIHPYICTSTKSFSDFHLLWCVGRPRPDMRTSMTLTWSNVKVKVTELPKLRKLHHSTSVSSAVLAWSSKLMVCGDSMGSGLQIFGARFLNFLLGKLSREFKLRYFTKFKWPYFGNAWCYSHVLGHAGSPTRTVYVDMTLTRSKVKVTEHLNFRQLAITAHFQVYPLCQFRVQLKIDGWRW